MLSKSGGSILYKATRPAAHPPQPASLRATRAGRKTLTPRPITHRWNAETTNQIATLYPMKKRRSFYGTIRGSVKTSSPGADKARVTWWKFLLTVDNSCFVIDWLSCLFVNYYYTVLQPIMQNKLYHYTFEMIHTTSNYRLCVCCFYVKTGFQFCPVLVIFQKIVLVYFSFCESGMSTITYTSQF